MCKEPVHYDTQFVVGGRLVDRNSPYFIAAFACKPIWFSKMSSGKLLSTYAKYTRQAKYKQARADRCKKTAAECMLLTFYNDFPCHYFAKVSVISRHGRCKSVTRIWKQVRRNRTVEQLIRVAMWLWGLIPIFSVVFILGNRKCGLDTINASDVALEAKVGFFYLKLSNVHCDALLNQHHTFHVLVFAWHKVCPCE